ncbi:MAG: type VI secretion system tube protein Hcp [Deltaproteobacteria bacterium]|nr:type VI secretion system tube protein Hcp [Deltaproteobacteria bacterium]
MIGNPNRVMRAGLFVLCLSFCASMAFEARGEAYIKFGDIKGESEATGHDEWCEIISFEHEIQRSTESSTNNLPARETVTVGEIVVVKELDNASPQLAEACLKGAAIPFVEIEVIFPASNPDRLTYYTYELKNVTVISYTISGSGQSNERPIEQLSLHFDEIRVTYLLTPDPQSGLHFEIGYEWKVELRDS